MSDSFGVKWSTESWDIARRSATETVDGLMVVMVVMVVMVEVARVNSDDILRKSCQLKLLLKFRST